MTSTAIYTAAFGTVAATAVLLGVLLLLAAREDRMRASRARVRSRRR